MNTKYVCDLCIEHVDAFSMGPVPLYEMKAPALDRYRQLTDVGSLFDLDHSGMTSPAQLHPHYVQSLVHTHPMSRDQFQTKWQRIRLSAKQSSLQ